MEKKPLIHKLPELLFGDLNKDLLEDQDSIDEFSETIETLLKISPEMRSKENVAVLARYFSSLDFFINVQKEHGQEMCNEVYQKLRIRYARRGEDIFHVNDIGDRFYVVLEGMLSVRIPRSKEIYIAPEDIEAYINK